jgi:hypothetical protein
MRLFMVTLFTIIMLGTYLPPLHAGVLLKGTSESPGAPDETSEQNIYVDVDRMRVEMEGKNESQVIIFRMDKEIFWVIDDSRKTYIEITRQDLEEMKREMDEAMKMFEEQMKNLPPQQRQMMEGMMKDQMPAQAPEITYEKIGSGEKVGSWVCDKYEGYAAGEKQMDVWAADWKGIGMDSGKFEVMKEMGEFFKDFNQDSAPLFFGSNEGDEVDHPTGLPVKTVIYSGNNISHITEIKEIKEAEFSPSLFDLPDGLKKEKMRPDQPRH